MQQNCTSEMVITWYFLIGLSKVVSQFCINMCILYIFCDGLFSQLAGAVPEGSHLRMNGADSPQVSSSTCWKM